MHELGNVVIAVLDAVQRTLARALGVLQVPAAHLRECILAVRKHDLLTAGEAAVAVTVSDHQRAAALDEPDQVRVVDLGADDGDAHTVVFLRIDLARLYLGERLAQQRQDQPLRADVAHEHQHGIFIARDGRVVQLARLADLGEDAADLVVLADRGADGGVRGVDAVVFAHGLEDLARDLLADVLDAVLIVGIRDVEVAVEEFVLVRPLRVHDLHVLDGAVVGLAHVDARHGVQEAVVALERALEDRAGKLAAVVGHVVGGQLHGRGVRRAQTHREATAQIQQHLRRVKAGIADRQIPFRFGLTDELVVRVVQQALKVHQMLQFLHCGPSFF